MQTIDLGPILSPAIEAIPDPYQPLVVTTVTILAVLSVLAQLLKPLGEAVSSLVGGAQWLFERVYRLTFGKRANPPEGPDPEPEPIPPEETIWESRPVSSPIAPISAQIGIPIITIANMKGGVGKTTLTANLAAAYQGTITKPVLVIDFDYQGSLTEMLWRHCGRSDPELRAHSLISGHLDPVQAQAHARTLSNGLEKIDLFPARYPLATIENKIMVDWITGSTTDDVRFRLSKILRHPAIQERYGLVLIDCPPRITTGTINALCASTHLLIPTKLDEMSAEAAVYFLQQIVRMQKREGSLFPSLSVLGIVPTMTREAARNADYEDRAIERLKAFGKEILQRDDLLMMDGRIPDKVDISRTAGVAVAYLRRAALRPIFDRLGREIWERIR